MPGCDWSGITRPYADIISPTTTLAYNHNDHSMSWLNPQTFIQPNFTPSLTLFKRLCSMWAFLPPGATILGKYKRIKIFSKDAKPVRCPPPVTLIFELPKSFVDFSLLSSSYSAVQISSLQILTTHLPSWLCHGIPYLPSFLIKDMLQLLFAAQDKYSSHGARISDVKCLDVFIACINPHPANVENMVSS